MTLSKRVLLVVAMMLIALVSVACGGGGGDAVGVAKTVIEATFKGDFNTIRNNICEARRGELTAEQEALFAEGFAEMLGAGPVDTSGITYTFNSETNMVVLGGTIKMTVQGTIVDVPADNMFGGGLPVVQEGGSWKV